MNHQPFENWFLSEEPLPADDERELRDHLVGCDQCSGLEDAWLDVANLFTEVPEIEPAPGFVNRWQATLEADQVAVKTMHQRWQSLIFLVLVANGVYKAATAMVLANGFRNAFVTLSRTVPQLIPTGWWVAIAITLGVSTIVWIVSMTKLSTLPRRTS